MVSESQNTNRRPWAGVCSRCSVSAVSPRGTRSSLGLHREPQRGDWNVYHGKALGQSHQMTYRDELHPSGQPNMVKNRRQNNNEEIFSAGPGFGRNRVNFLASSWHSAVFWIWCDKNVDGVLVFWLLPSHVYPKSRTFQEELQVHKKLEGHSGTANSGWGDILHHMTLCSRRILGEEGGRGRHLE